ncbi:hypothetical protein [Paenibacillus terricola]|nr:hypothetical protein [Paenibacillus terricola]
MEIAVADAYSGAVTDSDNGPIQFAKQSDDNRCGKKLVINL